MHKLLQRQLEQYIGSIDLLPEKWVRFFDAVNEAYERADADRVLLEHSLDLTSQELIERNKQLQQQIIAQEEQARLAEEQGRALLDVIHSVALGDLDIEIEVPEGIESLSELAIGIEMMVDDIREMLIEQERVRAEVESGRRQLQGALEEVLTVQRRYLRQEWEGYASRIAIEANRGYVRSDGAEEPTPSDDAWLPAMSEAARRASLVVESDPAEGATLAIPIRLYDEVIGVMGFSREVAEPWSEGEIAAAQAIIEQVALALENQRLFDEEQQVHSLLDMRVNELDCLNDIGRKIEEAPPIPELLQWGAERIPPAMRYPALCATTIEFEGNVYGVAEAASLPSQMVQGLYIGGEQAGRVIIAYTQERDFLDEESALLGDIVRRVSDYIENRRLFSEMQVRAEEQAILTQVAQTLAACQDVESVLDEAYRGASRLLDAANFYITLYDAERDEVALALRVVDGQMDTPHIVRPSGRGELIDYLLTTRQPLLLPDRVMARVEELGIEQVPFTPGRVTESWLGVPVLIGDLVLGTMVVLSYTTPNAYDEHSQDLLVALANQMALALQNMRSLEETRAALAEVEATHRSYLRRAWQDHLHQREMLQRSGFLYDGERAERAGDLIADPNLWRPEAEHALTEGSIATTRDGADDEGRTGLAAPITLRGQILGVLGVESPTKDYQWSEDDIALIEAVSDQLAQTLETARLFADTQRRAERERLISEITTRIRAATDIEGILETTAVELGQALGTSRALVRLGIKEPEPSPQTGSPQSDSLAASDGQPADDGK